MVVEPFLSCTSISTLTVDCSVNESLLAKGLRECRGGSRGRGRGCRDGVYLKECNMGVKKCYGGVTMVQQWCNKSVGLEAEGMEGDTVMEGT
jgi:hypothetical protein